MKRSRTGARPSRRLRHGGPSPAARMNPARKLLEGQAVWDLREGRSWSFQVVAAHLGLSPATAWRRYWWYWDAVIYPSLHRAPIAGDVVQRGTRECPSGSPWAGSALDPRSPG